VQTVTPEMARFFAGTRGCRRCGGRLDVVRDDAYDGAVTCRSCARRYLHVEFDVRPAIAVLDVQPRYRVRGNRGIASTLGDLLGRALLCAPRLGSRAARVPEWGARHRPRAGAIDGLVPVPSPDTALSDRFSANGRSAA
jgi:hypothetical protein